MDPSTAPEADAASADTDLVVIGAGIVGLATARALQCRHPDLRITVLDRHEDVGFHQTGRNSGVVHAGIYYKPGSLKARLCVEGARRLYEFSERHDIAVERCGKVIVATGPHELDRLDELERRGRANGVEGLRRVDAAGLAELEPHCRGIAALHSPATGIIDYPAVARALASELREGGARFALGRTVTASSREGDTVTVTHDAGRLRARGALFCAGLWADRLAVAGGAPADPRIVPFRGEYLRLTPSARHLVRSLIYPVPDPDLPFLGVHLTKHVSGDVLLGPSALLVGARDAYRLRRIRGRDLRETLAWPGTWRVVRRFWRTGLDELHMAVSRRAFTAACARYVPELRPEHVDAGWAGVRAQAVSADGTLVDDFVFSETPGALHVRNAPSPAATASLAIGEFIADRAQDAFDLRAPVAGTP
jgi:2-hydroxyglutarate dehydrogenase